MFTSSLVPLASVLLVLFISLVAGSMLPLRPLDPSWQWLVSKTLLNSALLPLIALALLQIGTELNPDDELLRDRQKTLAQFAVLAAIGYALLLPLQLSAGMRQQQASSGGQASLVEAAERQLVAIRKTVDQATSNSDLISRLQQVQGPVIAAADQNKPLPQLKAQVNQILDQLQIRIARKRESLPANPAVVMASDLTRNCISCLALAWGFAALAMRPGQELTLLEEIQDGLLRFRSRQRVQRRLGANKISDEDYLRQIQDEDP